MSNLPKIIIDVKRIINAETGEIKEEKINEKIPALDEYKLDSPIQGNAQLINLGEGVLANINATTEINLNCARCIKEYNHKIKLYYKQNFSLKPNEDEFPITSDLKIDIWPSIRQEILINLPMKPLCSPKCKVKKY